MIFTFGFLVLGVLYLVYERLVLSPLSRLPGPTLAATTRLVLIYHEFKRERTQWVHEMHMKYGPVVRIAPDELSFATWDAVKEIYVSDGSGYDKTGFYTLFDNFDTPCMFSTLRKAPHAERKKRLADRYNKSYIMQPEIVSSIQERAAQFVSKCTDKAGAAADIYIYLHCYALDCITYHLFDPYGTRSMTDVPDLMKVKDLSYHDNLQDSLIQYYVSEYIHPLAVRLLRRADRARRLGAQILSVVRRKDISSHAVLSKLQEHEKLSENEIASELMDHAIAGIDTTGDVLVFLMHHLSLPSSSVVQEKLHNELVENPGTPVDNLAYLDAVVKEGLRLFASIPMGLPRRVPKDGRKIGYAFVPEDTIVSCQAYTLHRFDTKVFPDAEMFVPERWLEKEGATERNQLFFTFSAGGRGCIGKHLAVLEMKVLLKEVYSAYRTSVAPEMKASMEREDQVISTRPKGKACLITFEKIA